MDARDAKILEDLAGFEENSRSGFILLYAALINHPVVGFKKPYDEGQAWIWILCNACRRPNGRQRIIQLKGGSRRRVVSEDYGDLVASLGYLAEAWGWGKTPVRTFLKTLEKKCQMIDTRTEQGLTRLTVNNFYTYQNPRHAKETISDILATNGEQTSDTNLNTLTRKHGNNKAEGLPAAQFYLNREFNIDFNEGVALVTEYGEREVWLAIDYVQFYIRNRPGYLKNPKRSVIDAIKKPWGEPDGYTRTILPANFETLFEDAVTSADDPEPGTDIEVDDNSEELQKWDQVYNDLPEDRRIEVGREVRRILKEKNSFAYNHLVQAERKGIRIDDKNYPLVAKYAWIEFRNLILSNLEGGSK